MSFERFEFTLMFFRTLMEKEALEMIYYILPESFGLCTSLGFAISLSYFNKTVGGNCEKIILMYIYIE